MMHGEKAKPGSQRRTRGRRSRRRQGPPHIPTRRILAPKARCTPRQKVTASRAANPARKISLRRTQTATAKPTRANSLETKPGSAHKTATNVDCGAKYHRRRIRLGANAERRGFRYPLRHAPPHWIARLAACALAVEPHRSPPSPARTQLLKFVSSAPPAIACRTPRSPRPSPVPDGKIPATLDGKGIFIKEIEEALEAERDRPRRPLAERPANAT